MTNKKIVNVEKILDFLKSNNLSKREFCKKYKFSLSYLNNLLKHNYNIAFTKLFTLARIMNVGILDLIYKNC